MKPMTKAACLILVMSFPLLFAPAAASARSWEQVDLEEALTGKHLNDVWSHASVGEEGVSLEVFAVGDMGTILLFDGQGWQKQAEDLATEGLNAVWGTSPINVYAVGNNGTVLHYDGEAWTSLLTSGKALHDVWGSSADDIFAVGSEGTILHYDGEAWTQQAQHLTIRDFTNVWAGSPSDIYAVGNQGTILHYDGESWSTINLGISENLNSVWGTSSGNVYAVGTNGIILHYDGQAWRQISRGTIANLHSVWGTSECNIFIVGQAIGSHWTILHHDGAAWSSQEIPVSPAYALNAIHGASLRDVYAVGVSGTILKIDPEDDLRPTVCSLSPYDGQRGVAVDAGVSVVFSAPMSRASLTAATFTLFSESGPVLGTVTVDGNTAFFDPEEALAYDTAYTVTVAGEAADSLGVSLGDDLSWSFSTGSEAGEGSNGGCFITTAR